MNQAILRMWKFCALLLALLLVNMSYSFIFRHHFLITNPYNRRVQIEQFARDRGAIMAGQTQLAYSSPSNDVYKYQRTYPNGPLYAPITGFYAYSYGTSALEQSYDAELAGTADSLAIQRMQDALTGKPAKGATIETTINPKLQQAAYQALGSNKGAVVALNPQTGAILAMVSTPSYDPNAIATHDLSSAQGAWGAATADTEGSMLNRATNELYPPGSTFKLVVAAAALEQGVAQPDTLLDTPAQLQLPGTNVYLPNVSSQCDGQLSMDRALQLSCNTAFANLGMQVGQEKIAEQAAKFGFGSRPLPDLGGGAASAYPTGMNQAQLAQSAIGQFDVKTSPLQMAMVGAAIANDGKLMQPYLVQTVRGPNLNVLSTTKPQVIGTPLSSANAKKMQQMMRNVVEKGISQNLSFGNVALAAKTGTAQHDAEHPYGWIVAYGPAQNAQVVVAVFIEDGPGAAANGTLGVSTQATPVAQAVLKAALQ